MALCMCDSSATHAHKTQNVCLSAYRIQLQVQLYSLVELESAPASKRAWRDSGGLGSLTGARGERVWSGSSMDQGRITDHGHTGRVAATSQRHTRRSVLTFCEKGVPGRLFMCAVCGG